MASDSDGGMFLFRTGNLLGLLNDQVNAEADPVVLDETTRVHIEEIMEQEKRIGRTELNLLARGEHNFFIPFTDIQSVETNMEGRDPMMRLKTGQGTFEFRFSMHPDDQVAGLAGMLTAARGAPTFADPNIQ
jgi:hypothetical protein